MQLPTQLRRSSIRPNAAGFTLIELIVVMTILALMMATVVPLYAGSLTRLRGDRAGRDLLAMLKYGQERAISDGTEYRLYIDEQKGRFWLLREVQGAGKEPTFEAPRELAGGIRTLPDGVQFRQIQARRDAQRRARYIALHPNGACDVADVRIQKRDKSVVRIATKGRLGQFETQGL